MNKLVIRIFILLFILSPYLILPLPAQPLPVSTSADSVSLSDSIQQPFKGTFYSAENGIKLNLDLYSESVVVPDFEFLGMTNGYMRGDTNERLYGTWIVLDYKIEGSKALLHMSNDIGSDTQKIEFTFRPDGKYTYHATGPNEVKKAINHKLYKITTNMVFVRQ